MVSRRTIRIRDSPLNKGIVENHPFVDYSKLGRSKNQAGLEEYGKNKHNRLNNRYVQPKKDK